MKFPNHFQLLCWTKEEQTFLAWTAFSIKTQALLNPFNMVFKQYILSKPLLYVYFSASVRAIMISFKYPFPHLVPDCIADQLCKLSMPHPGIHYPDRNFSSKPVPTAQFCSQESEKKNRLRDTAQFHESCFTKRRWLKVQYSSFKMQSGQLPNSQSENKGKEKEKKKLKVVQGSSLHSVEFSLYQGYNLRDTISSASSKRGLCSKSASVWVKLAAHRKSIAPRSW